MCDYVLGLLSADGDAHHVRRLAKAVGLKWTPFSEDDAPAWLEPGERRFLTSSSCACGTKIGSQRTQAAGGDVLAERKRLQKRGFSEAKILRLEADRARSADHKAQLASIEARSDPAVLSLHGLLSSVIEARAASSIGFLLHTFRGRIDSESIPVKGRVMCPIDDFGVELLLTAARDVGYWVTENPTPRPKSGLGTERKRT